MNDMYTIYCIEDINNLKYVGSTKQTIKKRLINHKSNKRNNNSYCSSRKLDLDNCKIYSLETDLSKSQKKERERYWINKIDCVNEKKLNFVIDEYNREHVRKWYLKNKDKKKIYNIEVGLFRSTRVCNGCYEFIKMLQEY
jgi:hypothetical protein